MQDCIICPTPPNHVCNLTEEMGTFTNLEFFIYNPFDLEACYQTKNNIINSHATITTDPPSPSLHSLQPRASFKPPKPTTHLHEDTHIFEMNPTTPLHEDTLTFEINPTTPLHEDTLTFEMNPTTPLHKDTLTFEMNSATPLHQDTSNGQPPETPHQEVQRCTRNTPCKLPGCMISQTPTKPGSSNSLVSPTSLNPPIEPDPLVQSRGSNQPT